jgi:hypothetical protein
MEGPSQYETGGLSSRPFDEKKQVDTRKEKD